LARQQKPTHHDPGGRDCEWADKCSSVPAIAQVNL
jgi:hypothetical protein